MTIDYTKLNERIVQQAHDATLTPDQINNLFQAKVARAQAMIEARAQVEQSRSEVYFQIED